jgi:hypothetical protein
MGSGFAAPALRRSPYESHDKYPVTNQITNRGRIVNAPAISANIARDNTRTNHETNLKARDIIVRDKAG